MYLLAKPSIAKDDFTKSSGKRLPATIVRPANSCNA